MILIHNSQPVIYHCPRVLPYYWFMAGHTYPNSPCRSDECKSVVSQFWVLERGQNVGCFKESTKILLQSSTSASAPAGLS